MGPGRGFRLFSSHLWILEGVLGSFPLPFRVLGGVLGSFLHFLEVLRGTGGSREPPNPGIIEKREALGSLLAQD